MIKKMGTQIAHREQDRNLNTKRKRCWPTHKSWTYRSCSEQMEHIRKPKKMSLLTREARASSSKRSRFLSPKTTQTQKVWNRQRVSLNLWAKKRAHLPSPRGSVSTRKLHLKQTRSGDKAMQEWWTNKNLKWKS